MLGSDRKWLNRPGASASAVQQLKQALAVELPEAYFDLLSYSNGGEGPLPRHPLRCCLDPAEVVTTNWRKKAFEQFFPGFVVFGGNGGGELLAFDIRDCEPWAVMTIDMTDINLEESVVPVATTFTDFLDMLGISKERD